MKWLELKDNLQTVSPIEARGQVTATNGSVLRAKLFGGAIGDRVRIKRRQGTLSAQIVGFSGGEILLSPFESAQDVLPGAEVSSPCSPLRIGLGDSLLGAAIDGYGIVRSRFAEPTVNQSRSFVELTRPAPTPEERITKYTALKTGIRSLDAFCPLAHGQRLSILAEPGVGKSTLLSMIADNTEADVNVIALIGERGREVREWIEKLRTSNNAQNTILVYATSDAAAGLRIQASLLATRISEYFRDQGKHVLLQIDSLTRMIRALRELGLAAGEMPVRQGYPLSVYSQLPRLIERAGVTHRGSITGLYTMLLSENLDNDPFIEEVKSLTDGHLYLSRDLAEKAHYPAICILSSLSRLESVVVGDEHREATQLLRRALSRLQRDREIVLLGGTPDKELRIYLDFENTLLAFLQQRPSGSSCVREVVALAQEIRERLESETYA